MEQIPDLNLFMMCPALQRGACRKLPEGFSFSLCRPSELELWKAFPFDSPELAEKYRGYMTRYFENVYRQWEDLFYERCLFVRDERGEPVATAFLWPAYGRINTLHWVKVRKEWEGRGIGRSLLARLLGETDEYPVYLHTQPGSFRAIKLYSDFGFQFLTDKQIGTRENQLAEALPMLEKLMPKEEFQKLRFTAAPEEFLAAAASSPISQF